MKPLSRPLLKTLGRVLLFVALLILPTVLRAGYYYRRLYVPQPVNRPDHAAVDVPTVALTSFADVDVRQGKGRVIIDRAHENMVEDVDLHVLLARLTKRGMEALSFTPGEDLSDFLRDAAALIVVAPHEPFRPGEIEAVERFVEQGGRALLVADPSRFSVSTAYDEAGFEYTVASTDVAAINSLASRFGLAFADDYIYNTAENAGNYQYVILRDFVEHRLTAGLDEVIFYAAHSVSAGEEAVITADERTTSSLSEQSGGLTTMGLGGGGRVLAVSDFTFMTEPYNSNADNNRLIANIADFLAGAQRTFGLTDFPHFFGAEVDLVSLVGEPGQAALSTDMIDQGYMLQSAFESTDRTLRWQTKPKAGLDTLFVGLYEGVEFSAEVSEILASQAITFTLETVEQKRATPTPTPRSTRTPGPVPPGSDQASPTPTEEPLCDWINVPGIGQVDAQEVALLYHNEEDGRQVVIVLAFQEEGLSTAIQRLAFGDFTHCLIDQDRSGDPKAISLALCPTEYEPIKEEPTLTPTPEEGLEVTPTPTPAAEGGILVVADDDGTGVYESWTSAYDFQTIATEVGYPATTWSTYWDGEVTLEQMQSYDAVIWCTGDYQEEETTPAVDDLVTISAYLSEGGRVILSGAFIGNPEESGLLLDIQVVQADHPLAEGFEADQIIILQRFTADTDYSPYLLGEDMETVVFARGPDSEFTGQAVIAVDSDEFSGSRTLLITFPIYLMPWEVQNQFGTNAIRWLMEEVGQ
jgi:hypothetical protein